MTTTTLHIDDSLTITRYTATSLADIASMFTRNAESARERARSTKIPEDKRVHYSAASTWQAAADILRHTTIKPEESLGSMTATASPQS